jgi:hypothetical protein
MFLAVIALFGLALSPLNAHSADWDSEELTADQLIEGTVTSSDSASAKEARDLWASKSKVLQTPMKSKLSAAETPEESRKQAQSQGSSPSSVTSTVQSTETSPKPADVSGSWSLDLAGSGLKDIALTLSQNGGTVFGTGQMKEGNQSILVAASGNVVGSKLNLDMVSLAPVKLYRLTMSASGNSASGEYSIIAANGAPTNGTAKGSRGQGPSID